MKAKLKNGELVYPSNYMFLECIGNMASNPTDSDLTDDGFKDLVYTEVDEVTVPYEEKETEIVVYFKKQTDESII